MDFDYYRIDDDDYVFGELDEYERREIFDEAEIEAGSMWEDPLGVYHLGLLYLYGIGVEKDVDEGIKLITVAAKDGLDEAQNQLGCYYDWGKFVNEDPDEAFKWHLLAADQGMSVAQCNVGLEYAYGKGVKPSPTRAFRYYLLSAKQGYARAQYKVAEAYYNGEGVAESKKVAVKWFRKAAEQGDVAAQNKLGDIYCDDDGVDQDLKAAFDWYMKAAEQDNTYAQWCVGLAYYNGEGVEQDYEEAFEWWLKAAEQGDADAQCYVGEMYRDGEGVDKDPKMAEEWFQKAAANGSEDAKDNLKQLQAEREKEVLQELERLTGLSSIKDDVRRLFKVLRTQKKRRESGLKVAAMTYHCVFTGNPGTGKTTVARILAKIYQMTGVVQSDTFVEAGRQDLVAEYMGQTAVKTNKLIDAALGGVLFIDEAYSLASGDDASRDSFGREAIETLLRRMENDRDKLVVIVAGYTKEMQRFIDSNPGLKSRFTRFFEFPDYSTDELTEIFVKMAREGDYDVSASVKAKVRGLVEQCLASLPKNFGNAREIRKFYEEAVARQASRIDDIISPTDKDLRRLSVKDIPDAMQV